MADKSTSKQQDNKATNFFGFDMSKAMDPSYFKNMMSSNEMMKFFEKNQMSQYFDSMKSYSIDTNALFEMQQQNINALIEANKTAASGYQDAMKKQLNMLEATMSVIKDKMPSDPQNASASKSTEDASKVMEKIMSDLSDLMNTVQKTNTEAATIVSDRIEKNFYDLKSIVQKAA